jgi:TonB family protein
MLATAVAVLFAQLLAQIPSSGNSRAPLPNGQRVHAGDGDVIVVDRGARVRIVRRNEGVARVVFNADQKWLVILLDWADEKGKQPDGMVDSTYAFYDLDGAWPLGERWQGSVVIEEYSLAGEGGRVGVGLRTDAGLVQLFADSPVMRAIDLFVEPSTVAKIAYRGAGAGAPGGRMTFDAAEQREVAQAAARAGGNASTQPSGNAPVRVGGNIRPPQKIVDAKPVYPQEAQSARVTGVVIIEATIATDGSVTDAKVLRSIPLLDKAALEAVKQWKFEPTQVNGVPVPVIMTVTVNFSVQ